MCNPETPLEKHWKERSVPFAVEPCLNCGMCVWTCNEFSVFCPTLKMCDPEVHYCCPQCRHGDSLPPPQWRPRGPDIDPSPYRARRMRGRRPCEYCGAAYDPKEAHFYRADRLPPPQPLCGICQYFFDAGQVRRIPRGRFKGQYWSEVGIENWGLMHRWGLVPPLVPPAPSEEESDELRVEPESAEEDWP